MSKQNGEWQSMVAKLKTSHGNILKTLENVESKMEALNETNKTLVGKNTGLNMSIQRVTKQYQDLTVQLKDVEAKCNMEKTNAFEQCYQMINDNKKKQWCTVCQKQGGRYYCSTQCEEYYWYVLFDRFGLRSGMTMIEKLMLFFLSKFCVSGSRKRNKDVRIGDSQLKKKTPQKRGKVLQSKESDEVVHCSTEFKFFFNFFIERDQLILRFQLLNLYIEFMLSTSGYVQE